MDNPPNQQGGAGGQGGGPEPSRFDEAMVKFPLGTLFIAAVCAAVHVYILVFDIDLNDLTISPYYIIYEYQWYRLIVPSFVHANLMHIGMNMSSFVYLGASIEKTFGSIYYMFIIATTTIASNLMYIGICFTIWYVLEEHSDTCDVTPTHQNVRTCEQIGWLMYPSVGFSGVLFGLAAMDSYFSKMTQRSFYGCINVPTRVYPWVMLFGLQIVMELVGTRVSFMGHFTGLMVGIMHSYNLLWFLLPKLGVVKYLELIPLLSVITSRPNFLKVADQFPRADNTQDTMACCHDSMYGVKAFFRLLRQFLDFFLGFVGMSTGSAGGGGEPGLPRYAPVPTSEPTALPQGHRMGGGGGGVHPNNPRFATPNVPPSQPGLPPVPAPSSNDDENVQLQRALQMSLSQQV